MTPDAIQALQDVARSIDKSSQETAGVKEALVADQQSARRREHRRFRTVYRALAGLGAGLVVALVLLAIVVVQGRNDAVNRDERSELAADQRECSDTLMADALVRVSIYATARGAADPVAIARLRERVMATRTDPSQLGDLRDEVDVILRTLPADTLGLREDAARANDRLLRVREICYRGQPPADPLAS